MTDPDVGLRVIVPSRGRPENIARLISAMCRTTSGHGPASLLVIVDEDDPEIHRYHSICDRRPAVHMSVNRKYRKLGPILNAYAASAAVHYSHLAFMGDDHVPRTKDWDAKLVNSLAGRAGVAYGDDLLQGEALPTAVVMSSDLVRLLGYMAPPSLEHLFMDNFWKQLGRTVGNLKYLSDVVIEHIHPAGGKTEWTDAYRRTCGDDLMAADGRRYDLFMTQQWPGDSLRLRLGLCDA